MAKDLRNIDSRVDDAILAYLPEGGEIFGTTSLGLSDYCETIRIDVRLEDGTSERYFEKRGKGQDGYELVRSHFHSESSLFKYIPEFIPRPIGWGTYKSNPDHHFFLLEFVDMIDDDIPIAESYVAPIVALHLKSKGLSPDGKFGFPVQTHFGHLPQQNNWETSWEVWWTKHMTMVLDREEEIHGPHTPEGGELKELFLKKVAPRYLRPTESDGRSITPCLLHTDLWPGNINYRLDNETVSIYDANGLWGHNEMELALLRNPRYPLGKAYLKQYREVVHITEPEEDADSRNIMYLVRHQVCLASIYPNDPKLREIFFSTMRLIVNRVLNEETQTTQGVSSNLSECTKSIKNSGDDMEELLRLGGSGQTIMGPGLSGKSNLVSIVT